MGIIKLKNANDEQTAENAALEEQQAYKLAVEAQVGAELPQEPQEQWDDPAVLHEDETRTDENSRHYVLNNGTAKSVFNAEPVSFFDEEEKKWKHIDNSLEEKEDAFETKSGKFKTRISKVHKGKKVAISKSDKQLSWEYLGKQVATVANENIEDVAETILKVNNGTQGVAKHINSSAVYENIEKDTDLEYCLLGNNLKENIIVKEKSADYRYLFALKTEGLKLRLSDNNENLELYTEKEKEGGTVEQKVEFTIPGPYMYDANGVASDDVYYELEPSEDGKFAFAVVANEEWVNAADRAFPVTIDPQVVTNDSSLVTQQVQYRIVSSGSGSGSSVGSWTNTSYSDIKVYKDDYIEYRTCLTIKRSLMNLPNNRIVSVKLILTPSTTFSGSLYVNNYYHSYNSNEGKLEQDITNIFKSYTTGDFNIYVEPYYYGYINGYFSMSANPPIIEIEYLTNENTRPTKKTFTLAGIATGEVDLATGDMTTSFCDIPAENSVMGLSVAHVYKKSAEKYLLGDNFRLNLHETLLKNGDSALDTDYIYTDANGDKHGFNEHYYYINTSGKKEYVTVAKTNITVEEDGRLKYGKYEVFVEYKSATGLKAMPQLEGLNDVEWLDQRSDELKQNEEKLKGYQSALNEFVVRNKNTADNVSNLKDSLSTSAAFETFINKANNSANIVLTKNEAINYRSLLLQQTNLNKEIGDNGDANEDVSGEEEQLALVNEQITLLKNKKSLYIEQIKSYYKEYRALVNEKEQIKEQMPVNFLTDGKIIKGYNEAGRLVAVYDMYENYAVIEYEKYYVDSKSGYRIARAYDNTEKQVLFSYNEQNQLAAITDTRGRKTCFTYNSNNVLTNIVYDTGENLTISYSGNNIYSLRETKNGLLTYIYYSYNRPTQISHYSTVDNIAVDGQTTGNKFISQAMISYNPYSSYPITATTVTENLVAERYYFDANGNCTGYRKADFDEASNQYLVSAGEQYTHNPYWVGSTQQSDPKEVVISAARSSLNKTALDSYVFESGDMETTVIDQFNNPVSKTTSEILISEWLDTSGVEQQTTQTTVVDYTYDDNQKLIQERAEVTYSNLADPIVSYKKYNYNAYGDVIRTESYVQGEEYTTGKTIEETVYDDKGNVVKSFTYNSLDTSSKFYTETEYDDNGKVLAEIDETGENKTKFNYVDGTSTVREEVLPNGSKFAYGRDYDDTVTAISQSTEDGEENFTQKVRRCGVVVELKSGNNNVKYAYNHKRKLKAVMLNGDTERAEYNYDEIQDSYGSVAKETVTTTYKYGDVKQDEFETEKDGKGNVLKVTANSAIQIENVYDKKGQLDISKDKITGKNYRFERDEFDNVTAVYEVDSSDVQIPSGYGEAYAYNSAGKLAKKTIVGTVPQEYTYGYKTDSTQALETITVNGSTVKPKLDVLWRNKGKEICIGTDKIAEESIVYRKVGDHATNMPATIRFGNKFGENFALVDSLRYAYDKMGNIEKVYENGELAIRYQYDALNRLIREDNKVMNKTVLFAYDNNGNILKQRKFAFTLKNAIDIEELDSEDKVYIYAGDKLLAFNGEGCTYNETTNVQTTYRGKTLGWTNRRVTSYNGIQFSYDGQGRRIAKGDISYIYDSQGRLLKQSNDLEFFYDHSGVSSVKHGGKTYFYRKDVLGNVIALLDTSGAVVVKYTYDAWGNHAEEVLDSSCETLANLNPFRYRSYYYDTETDMYFLKTRYYDPEIGRFMTIDGIEYLDPDTINGLNLYAYCGNNPVMNIDSNGNKWWEFWKWDWASIGKIALGVVVVAGLAVASVFTGGAASVIFAGAAIGAGAGFLGGGISGVVSGGGLAGFANGALMGTITGAISGAVAASPLGVWGQVAVNAFLSAGNYWVGQKISGDEVTIGGLIVSAGIGAFLGALGGPGWTSTAMAGETFMADIAMNMGKNFLQHSAVYLSKGFLVKFFSANAGTGVLSGLYNMFGNYFNKRGNFFGF